MQALREINTLLKCPHVNIVKVQEILVGDGMEDVFICMEFVQHDLKGTCHSGELHRHWEFHCFS